MSHIRTKSLAQIVIANHLAASVFEKHHLDFCCKGKRSLQQACAEGKVPVEQVITELDTITMNSGDIPLDFKKISLSQLADYIVLTHHAYVKKEMPSIFGYLQKVASKHQERHPELGKIVETFTALQKEMTQHMTKEEDVLFPRIKSLEKTIPEQTDLFGLHAPITLLEEEHDHAGRMLDEIRNLTNNYMPPADACTTYRLSFASLEAFESDLHQHVHLENNILFPRALALMQSLHKTALN